MAIDISDQDIEQERKTLLELQDRLNVVSVKDLLLLNFKFNENLVTLMQELQNKYKFTKNDALKLTRINSGLQLTSGVIFNRLEGKNVFALDDKAYFHKLIQEAAEKMEKPPDDNK